MKENLQNCKLCKKNLASKTNSHIIPWSLIKDVVNQPGFNDRGYDVTFGISSFDAPSLFIGRSVLPEHIERVTRMDIEAKVVDQTNNPLSRDYILCPGCEKNLGILESEFISRVYKKLGQAILFAHDSRGNKIIKLTGYETNLTYILAYSIFFRTSIVRFNNYSLDPKIEERIREILYTILTTKTQHNNKTCILTGIKEMSKTVLEFPLVTFYMDTDTNQKSDENLIIQTHTNKPYFIWANKLIFQLYKKSSQIKSTIESFYGLSQMVNLKEAFYFHHFKEMNVCVLSNNKRKKIISNALQKLAKDNMQNMIALFDQACNKLIRRKPTQKEKNTFAFYYSINITATFQSTINEAFKKSVLQTFNLPYNS